jgi:hypothetical protein
MENSQRSNNVLPEDQEIIDEEEEEEEEDAWLQYQYFSSINKLIDK